MLITNTAGKNSKLTEDDYLSAIAAIQALQECRTREQLMCCFTDQILELLGCQVYTMAWMDFDFVKRISLDNRPFLTVNFPESEVPVMNSFLQYNRVYYESFPHSSRVVMAHDVDFPREALHASKRELFQDYPEYTPENAPFIHSVQSMMAITDQPDMRLASSVFRTGDNIAPFTYREIRLAELLQPSLVYALRTLAINEELQRYRALVEALAEGAEPIAQFGKNGEVFYANSAFTDLCESDSQAVTPQLFKAISRQSRELLSAKKGIGLTEQFSFCRVDGQVWRLETVPLHSGSAIEAGYLVRLHPVIESYVKSVLNMQDVELTPREMEIALLIKDGYSSKSCSDRLFVSENTIKTHIRNIHTKFGTNSRAELVAKLNQG